MRQRTWGAVPVAIPTGLDLSPKAIGLATRFAAAEGVSCRFEARDLTQPQDRFANAFDFVFDWEVLHHVFPVDRTVYVANVHRMLRKGGQYFSVCFSEDEPARFAGKGKVRTTALGTELYFSSEEEMRELFSPLFNIEQLCTVEVAGKKGFHLAIKALLSKRNV